jgi:signal transduction histidine kinase
VNLLNQLSLYYLTNDPARALSYSQDALALSKSLSFLKGETVALMRVGETEFRQSNYARAVDFTTRSLKLAESIQDSLAMAKAYRILGLIYTYGLRQYDIALQYQLSALKIFERRNDKRNMAAFYGNVTWVYASMNKNLPEAKRLAKQGVHLSDSIRDKQLLSYNYNSLGLLFLQERRPDSAHWYIDQSIQLGKELKDRALVAYNNSIKGEAYFQQQHYQKAIESFQLSAQEGRALHMNAVLKDASEGLTKSYEATKNFPLAYQNLKVFNQLKDSLVGWETAQKVLLIKLQFEQQKAKIAELELSNHLAQSEKQIYTIFSVFIILLMMTVLTLVIRNNWQRKASNRMLQEKNDEIELQNVKLKEANAIKDKIFSIIGHDLRSPLASLKGLLGLVIRNEITGQEFKSFAPKINQHVTGVSETLENLLSWSRSQMRGLKPMPIHLPLRKVIDKSIDLFAETAAEKKILISTNVREDESVFADENQLGLIFRNLIHNAIKFTTEGGSVRVTTDSANEFLVVKVSDTGLGMTDKQLEQVFQNNAPTTRGTMGEKGTGLGLLLCKEMVENNGGKITVESEVGRGATFHVFLKRFSN